jgi:PleD family two-component response regulator
VDRVRTATPEDLTCSVGITSSLGGEEAEKVLSRADSALYDAKRRGRNSVVVSDAIQGTPGPPSH